MMATAVSRTPEGAPGSGGLEYLPAGELRALRERRLAEAVRRAACAPFYVSRVAGLGAVGERLAGARFQATVPLTTKADLRAAGTSAWVAAASPVLVLGTSGTTGTRIALPYTVQDLRAWHALAERTLSCNGLASSDVTLLPVPVGLFTGGHGMLGGLRHLGCTVIPLGPTNPAGLAEALAGGFGVAPTAVVGLPSHMLRMLDALPDAGCDPATTSLRIGSFGAEPWSEEARARLETGYGILAMDSYGIGELCGPGVAAECDRRAGMHVWEDAFFAEIIDPRTGDPVPDGTPGELVLTNLFREAYPLLRFRTGDQASLLSEPCACGRAHRRISRIARRLDQTLVISGVNIDPVDVERLLYAQPWVGPEFTLAMGGEHRDTLVLHLEPRPALPPPADADARLTALVRGSYPVRVSVQWHGVGELERAPGKARRLAA